MRRDAANNRQRLIDAAAEIMRESGGDVPLEAIAERAGVTRGTMYRNFPHRRELYATVLDRELDAIRDRLSGVDHCSLFELMRMLIDLMDVYEKFQRSVPDIAEFAAGACQLDNMTTLVEQHLALARQTGDVRSDLGADDILLAVRMIAIGWRIDGAPDKETAISKRLRLMIDGLGPRQSS